MEEGYTSRDIADSDYFTLAQYSYRDIKLRKDVYSDTRDTRWRVIEKMDEENGAQGVALAPLGPDRKVDTSQVVIAYRGTVPKDLDGDITADIIQVGLSSHYIPKRFDTPLGKITGVTSKTQFKSALNFSDEISKKYKNAKITYTGHSLGGALAQYVAAERKRYATTFAAPNAYGLLSKEAKRRVDEGKTKNTIRDYIHDNDIIGRISGGDPLIGKQYVTKSNEKALSSWGNPIAGHGINTYTGKFSGADGSIEFRMKPEEVIKAVKSFRPQLQLISDWRRLIKRYVEDDAHAVREIYTDMLGNVSGSGKYPLLSEHDVTSHFRDRAMTIKGSDYYFIDVDLAMDLCNKLTKFEHKVEMFLDELIEAAKTTGTLDIEISNWFGR